MDFSNIFEHHPIAIFAHWGLVDSCWQVNARTVFYTWVALLLLVLLVAVVRYYLRYKPDSLVSALSVGIYEQLQALVIDNVGESDYAGECFLATAFLFTFFCTACGVLPRIEEATADINTALAVGSTCFLYVQYRGLRKKGFGYFSKFFQPFVLFLPMNLIGQLSKAVSLSFRLFGNVLAGFIIWTLIRSMLDYIGLFYYLCVMGAAAVVWLISSSQIWKRLGWGQQGRSVAMVVLLLLPAIQALFGVLEGLLQAGIVLLLTCMYLASELSEQGGH